MNRTTLSWAGLILAVGVSGCTSAATGPPDARTVNPAGQSVLQFAVGTANIAGTPGMNVVVTDRQPNGLSAVLLDTPTLTGPFTLPAGPGTADGNGSTAKTGPSLGEVNGTLCGTPCITGTPQFTPGGTPAFSSTFGTSGGAFGLAFAPANSNPNGGGASIYQPYQVPLYGAKLFTPWGGPPAYDPAGDGKGTRDGTFADTTVGILGVSLGLDIFKGVAVGTGAYNLSLNIPFTSGSQTVASAFALGAVTPIAGLPVITGITFDGTGQATVAYTLPAGVVGAYVEIIDNGPSVCNAAGDTNFYGAQTTGNPGTSPFPTTYYTFWVTASGTVTVTNANAPGPRGTTLPAICTLAQNSGAKAASPNPDTLTAYVIGFDYDHYSITYNKPVNTNYPQKPALPASADVVVSAAFKATSP